MMSNPNPSAPNPEDLVLGGQTPPPTSGAVLGGLTGLQQRFTQVGVAQKLSTLTDAVKYGADSLELFQLGLEDASLSVRYLAYKQLLTLGAAPSEGIPLQVGDEIYGGYKSDVSYGDDFFYIKSEVCEWEYYHASYNEKNERPFYHPLTDAVQNSSCYHYVSDAPDERLLSNSWSEYEPNLVTLHIECAEAEAKAKEIFISKFADLPCDITLITHDSQDRNADLKAWVATKGIRLTAKIPKKLKKYISEDWAYRIRLVQSLHEQQKFSQLAEIWEQLGYKPLAFVHRHVIDRPCFLRLTALMSPRGDRRG